MEGKEHLYYALGELAYAVAVADGKIQQEERQKLHDIVVEATACHKTDFNISGIIFHILQKDHVNLLPVYDWAIKEIREHSYFLTEDMKVDFIGVIEKVARAFGSITIEEENIIEKFKQDIEKIKPLEQQ